MKRFFLVLALLVSAHVAPAQMVPGSRTLNLGADKKPTQQVSLASGNWIDQLDKANLPGDTVYSGSALNITGAWNFVVPPSFSDAAGSRAKLGLGSISTYNVGTSVGTVPVYQPNGLLTSASSATLVVDAALGSDAVAKRGFNYPYGTLAKAFADSTTGDTIEIQGNTPVPLPAGTYILTGKTFRGHGVNFTRMVPADGVHFICAGSVDVHGLSIDTGKDAVPLPGDNAEGSPVATLFDCSGSVNSTFADLYIHGVNGNVFDSGENGLATQNVTFRNIHLDHVFQGWYMNDGPNSYHRDMLFDSILCEWTFARGIGVRGANGYNAAIVNGARGRSPNHNLKLNNVTARYAGSLNAQGLGSAGSLAVEIWHGWSGVYMNKVFTEDSGYGISTASCDDVHLNQCEARNCNFLLEAADPLDNWMTDCVADSRPSPDSPFLAGGPHGEVAAQNWVGGELLNTCIYFSNFEITTPVPCLLQGAVIRGFAAGGKPCPIYTQNISNVSIVNNEVYSTIEGINALPGVFILLDNDLDLSSASTQIVGNRFHGTTNGQVIAFGGNYNTAKLGCVVCANNSTDSTYISGVGNYSYHGAVLSHVAFGNYAVLGGQSLPNDNPPAGTVVSLEQFGNGDATGDWGAICQQAANALGAANGGIIQLAARNYNFATKVTLPPGVIVRGNNAGPRQKAPANISAPPPEAPTANGTVISCVYAGGTDTDPACFTLGKGATVRDLSFYEPNQKTSGTPTAYPYCIRMVDYGSNIINVEFINDYRGIDVGSNTVYAGRFVIENITGNPLFSGLRIDGVGDFSTVDGVHFADTWTRSYPDIEAFQQANAVVLSVGRADNIQVNNVSSYQYHIGLDLFIGAGNLGAYGVFDKLSFDLSDICVNVRGTGSRQPKISRGIFLSKKYAVYQPGGGGSIMFENCYSGAGVGGFPQWEISGITEAYNCKFENNGQQFVATIHVSSPSAINLQGLSFDLSPQAVGNTGAAVQVDGNGTNGFIPPYYVAFNRSLESPVLASGSSVKIITRASTTGLFTTNKSLATGDNYPTFDANANSVNGANTSQQGLSCNAGGLKTYQAAVYIGNATPGAAITISANVGTTQLKTLAQGFVASNGTVFVSGVATFNYTAAQTVTLNVNVSSGTATLVGNAQTSYATLTDY